MKGERPLFDRAIALPPDERAAYLDNACGDDADLRRRVEALLAAHDQAAGILDAPPPGLTATTGDPPTHAPPEPAGSTVGPYKLLELVGEGGMGAVYMAEQQRPVRRRVALKLIKPGMDTKQAIARFEAERQALAMMDHPNIARVLDAGSTDAGRLYFVMELVKGVPITDYCDQNKLTPRQRLELFVQVCHAVQHAHQKGVIHRDLKPTNVLVTLHDGKPVPKIIDFGIAKATSGNRLTDLTLFTNFAQMVGTPLYMSPEQAELSGLDVDTRSDVYSLGVLLYELLTGTTPFEKERLKKAAYDEIRRIIREEDPPRPSTRLSTLGGTLTNVSTSRATDAKRLGRLVRGDLDWIVMKAIEKDRTRRYETAGAFAADLKRQMDGLPVEACPPSRLYKLRKFARRNKVALGVALGVAGAVVSATAVSTILAARATRAERRTDAEAARARDAAAVSAAVNAFLNEDLLSQASPAFEPDRDIKLRTVLDRAAKRVQGRFDGQPKVEAAILHTLGETYQSLGEYGAAERHLQRALALRRAHSGPEHRDTLATSAALANVFSAQARYAEAEGLALSTLAIRRRTLGAGHRDTLSSMAALGDIYLATDRLAEAEKLVSETLDARKRFLGAHDRDTLASVGAMGRVYMVCGRCKEAEAVFQSVYDEYCGTLGAEDPNTLLALARLTNSLFAQRRYEAAIALNRPLVDVYQRVLGINHPTTVWVTDILATSLCDTGRADEGLRLQADCLRRLRAAGRSAHPATLRMAERFRINLGHLHMHLVEVASPSPEARRAAVDLAQQVVDLLPEQDAAWRVLAWAQLRSGDCKTCIATSEKAIALERDFSPRSFSTSWLCLALAYHASGDRESAVAYYNLLAVRVGDPPHRLLVEAAEALGLPSPRLRHDWEPGAAEARALARLDELNPRAAWPQVIRLDVLTRLGRPEQAAAECAAMVERLPDLVPGDAGAARPEWSARRRLYRPLANGGEAFVALLRVRHDDPDLWVERGDSLIRAFESAGLTAADYGRYLEGATSCYRRALRLRAGAGPATAPVVASAESNPAIAELEWRLAECEAASAEYREPGAPFGVVPSPVPGLIQAEDFDRGGQGVGYYDDNIGRGGSKRPPYRAASVEIDVCGDEGGGCCVGGIRSGEWLAYSVDVALDGEYDIDLRVGTPYEGRRVRVEFPGTSEDVAPGGVSDLLRRIGRGNGARYVTLPNTGHFQSWQTVTLKAVKLRKGPQVMKIVFDPGAEPRYVCNFNWLAVRKPSDHAGTSPTDR